jgi:RNA polymerase sigma-70 factor (ECF subfamily)
MSALRLVSADAPRPSDEALVRSTLEGEAWAAEALYRRHHGLVAGLAFRLLGGDADVDDVVQDAFLQALASLSRLENPAVFSSWVASMVVGIVGKKLRRRRLLERLGLRRREALDVDTFLATSCPPDVASELKAVYAVIDALGTDARLALVLRRVEGFTIEETAKQMNLSTGTVKRRFAEAEAALARLKEQPA